MFGGEKWCVDIVGLGLNATLFMEKYRVVERVSSVLRNRLCEYEVNLLKSLMYLSFRKENSLVLRMDGAFCIVFVGGSMCKIKIYEM